MTKEDFQDKYFDELLDLVNDSDNLVRIRALMSFGKLMDYLEESQVQKEIMPSFLRLSESILEDEDGMQALSLMFGKFVYGISEKFYNVVEDNQEALCKYFSLCISSKDP
jgi:hypothetical protein